MRSSLLSLVATLSLALFIVANPEPCSDHPGVVHDFVLTSGEELKAAKAAAAKKASASKKKKTSATSKKVSAATATSKKIVKVSSTKKTKTTAAATKSTGVSSKSKSAFAAAWSKKAASVKKNKTPVVKKPTSSTIKSGASNVIDSFSKYLPAGVKEKLEAALQKQIDAQVAASKSTVTVAQLRTVVDTSLPTATFVNGSKVALAAAATPTPHYITITESVVTTSTIVANDTASVNAALNIQTALKAAFAAAGLSQGDLDAETTASLEKCLTTVLASGGMPDGYTCLTTSGSDASGLQDTLNTILEQFVGILPNVILDSVFDAVTPLLADLLPASEAALVAQIQASIQSVIATLSGSSVTALEQVQACYTEAVTAQGNSSAIACITKSGGAMSTLQTASNGVLEQFVGVLPASLTTAVQNILTYNLDSSSTANATLAAQVSAQISNAINSVASTLSGNTVTLAETLQACASELIATGNGTAAALCIKNGGAAQISSTMILGVAEQFAGYLPSSFFTDLTNYATPLLSNATANPEKLTASALAAEFDSYFNSASYGPAYVTCLHQVQACVVKAIKKTKTNSELDSVCPGPVKGCNIPDAATRRKRTLLEHKRRSVWVV